MSNSIVPAREDREQALRRVLESQAFARSEQLKNFLRYVCELEIAGRGGEIKEYSIGVEALGRPTSYSPRRIHRSGAGRSSSGRSSKKHMRANSPQPRL